MINGAAIAQSKWRLIQRNATSITIYREGVTLAAQTVRITVDNQTLTQIENEAGGRMSRRACIVHGIRQHPTAADTDIQVNDRFAIGQVSYEVYEVVILPGGIQAMCQRMSGY